ncbi:MAG: hypothetical protein H8E12_19640 [Rhodobacteraceae bacterium]|nr:hypothetical protein [Paracoccaceae bacterium]
MKVGNLVKLKGVSGPRNSGTTGVIVKLFKKKCWRTQELGPNVNWDLVDPEPHAEVMINENLMNFPVAELEPA